MKKLLFFVLFFGSVFCIGSFAITENSTAELTFLAKSNDGVVVGLYPLGTFDKELLKLLQGEVQFFYKIKVLVMEGSALPQKAFYSPRNRYRADTLLDYLLQVRPKNIDYMVGLTEKDISCTNGKYADWGVFGLGFMPGRSCVISTHRLHFGQKSLVHFQERISKVVIHELGHNFGLDHCTNPNCIMHDAEGTIKSVDHEKKALCAECKKILEKKLKSGN